MALSCEGTDVLTFPEFAELMAHLHSDQPLPAELTAWWSGEPVSATALMPALDVGARLLAADDIAHTIIDQALSRLQVPV